MVGLGNGGGDYLLVFYSIYFIFFPSFSGLVSFFLCSLCAVRKSRAFISFSLVLSWLAPLYVSALLLDRGACFRHRSMFGGKEKKRRMERGMG